MRHPQQMSLIALESPGRHSRVFQGDVDGADETTELSYILGNHSLGVETSCSDGLQSSAGCEPRVCSFIKVVESRKS